MNWKAWARATAIRCVRTFCTTILGVFTMGKLVTEVDWSAILGYTNNQIKSIESTHTDPTAPIDLTLYYADGTLIST